MKTSYFKPAESSSLFYYFFFSIFEHFCFLCIIFFPCKANPCQIAQAALPAQRAFAYEILQQV